MATSSKGRMSFLRHARLGNKGLPICIWGGFGLPKCGDVFISSPSVQLSLGGLLSSRARLCFAGRQELKCSLDAVNGWPSSWRLRQSNPRRLFDLRQRMATASHPRRLFYLRQQAERSRSQSGMSSGAVVLRFCIAITSRELRRTSSRQCVSVTLRTLRQSQPASDASGGSRRDKARAPRARPMKTRWATSAAISGERTCRKAAE